MAATEKRPDLIAIARDLAGVPMCDDYEKMISGMLYVFSTVCDIDSLYHSHIACSMNKVEVDRRPGTTPSFPAFSKAGIGAAS